MKNFRMIINDLFIISTAMILGLGIQEMIMHFTRGLSSFEMPWYIPLTIPLTAFLCALPSVLVNDCSVLKKGQLIFRVALHFICLLLVVSLCGYIFRWFSSLPEYLTIMTVYTIIYVGVWMVNRWMGKKNEKIINQALKSIQDKE